mmetsp:Transcript_66143/g.193599  ORF Transcript_66143/g.193599 Transcript_66143/m.193599 type:complete len:271 (+) Transcript_66143:74-886(+)
MPPMMLLRLSCAASSASSLPRSSFAALRSTRAGRTPALLPGEEVLMVVHSGSVGGGVVPEGGCSCTYGAPTWPTARLPVVAELMPWVVPTRFSTAVASADVSLSARRRSSASTPSSGVAVTRTVTEPAGPAFISSRRREGCTWPSAASEMASLIPASRLPTRDGLVESQAKSTFRSANWKQTQGPRGSQWKSSVTMAGAGRGVEGAAEAGGVAEAAARRAADLAESGVVGRSVGGPPAPPPPLCSLCVGGGGGLGLLLVLLSASFLSFSA